MKVFSMAKFFVLNPSFAKTAGFSLKMSELEIFLLLTQVPNTSMQISRDKGATKKAFRKMVHDNFLKNILAKGRFLPKIGGTTKQIISHKSVHWYQCISLWKMLGGEY